MAQQQQQNQQVAMSHTNALINEIAIEEPNPNEDYSTMRAGAYVIEPVEPIPFVNLEEWRKAEATPTDYSSMYPNLDALYPKLVDYEKLKKYGEDETEVDNEDSCDDMPELVLDSECESIVEPTIPSRETVTRTEDFLWFRTMVNSVQGAL